MPSAGVFFSGRLIATPIGWIVPPAGPGNSSMILDHDAVERYARHIVLREVGGAGQQRLLAASVLVVGAGGLGAGALPYLAAMGVGRLVIVDDDRVALSNLQRQVLYGDADLGRPKAEAAAAAVERLNAHVAAEGRVARLSAENAAMVAGHAVVLDGSDNAATRLLLADACEAARVPLVTAALGAFDGSVTVLAPHLVRPDGRPAPRLRDIFPDLPAAGELPTCAETGVAGPLAGMLGTLQAMEALKLITGAGEPLIGRLLLVDALAMRFETIAYARP